MIAFSGDGAVEKFAFSTESQTVTAAGGIATDKSAVEMVSDGGAIIITASPSIQAGTKNRQLLLLCGTSETNTIQLNDGDGVHLHGGAAVFADNDSMLLHWDTNDSNWHEISRNFGALEISFPFTSPAGSSGTFYYDGFYKFASTDNDFNPSVNFGTVNSAIGAHLFFVQAAGGAGGTDTVIRITGTKITDAGVRTTGATVDVTIDDAGAAGTYYETPDKWIGQIAIEKLSGPDLLCNYGFVKYWDFKNSDFHVVGINATWFGGGNDSNANIILRHHKSTGWTYNVGSTPTPPTAITNMQTDYDTEVLIVNNENGAWKRDNLNTLVLGASDEGIILEFVTTANKTFELGNVLVTILPH